MKEPKPLNATTSAVWLAVNPSGARRVGLQAATTVSEPKMMKHTIHSGTVPAERPCENNPFTGTPTNCGSDETKTVPAAGRSRVNRATSAPMRSLLEPSDSRNRIDSGMAR